MENEFPVWPFIVAAVLALALGGTYLVRRVLAARATKRLREERKRLEAVAAAQRQAKRKAEAKVARRLELVAAEEAARLASERIAENERKRIADSERERAKAKRAQAAFDAAAAAAAVQQLRFQEARQSAIRKYTDELLSQEYVSLPKGAGEVAKKPPPAVRPPDAPIVLVAPKVPRPALVLVVDDSKLVRYKTGRLLEQHHFEVAYAVDGQDALKQILTRTPDVVITDVEMPNVGGFELCQRLRSGAKTSLLPIIMITAAPEEHRANSKRAGVSALLGKPYDDETLVAFIRQAVHEATEREGEPTVY